MKISIITVVLNDPNGVELTIKSVLSQTYKDFEYIVIDGCSTDSTCMVIEKYSDQIDYYQSEKDDGIYDAMNKGIAAASGEWCVFMNSGDVFYSKSILLEIFQISKLVEVDVIYGNHQVVYRDFRKTKVIPAGSVDNLRKGANFCHQATIIRTHLLKANPYDLNLSTVADFDFFYRAHLNGAMIKQVDLIIATIVAGGVSDMRQVEVIRAWRDVVKNANGDKLSLLLWCHYKILILETFFKQFFKQVILGVLDFRGH